MEKINKIRGKKRLNAQRQKKRLSLKNPSSFDGHPELPLKDGQRFVGSLAAFPHQRLPGDREGDAGQDWGCLDTQELPSRKWKLHLSK